MKLLAFLISSTLFLTPSTFSMSNCNFGFSLRLDHSYHDLSLESFTLTPHEEARYGVLPLLETLQQDFHEFSTSVFTRLFPNESFSETAILFAVSDSYLNTQVHRLGKNRLLITIPILLLGDTKTSKLSEDDYAYLISYAWLNFKSSATNAALVEDQSLAAVTTLRDAGYALHNLAALGSHFTDAAVPGLCIRRNDGHACLQPDASEPAVTQLERYPRIFREVVAIYTRMMRRTLVDPGSPAFLPRKLETFSDAMHAYQRGVQIVSKAELIPYLAYFETRFRLFHQSRWLANLNETALLAIAEKGNVDAKALFPRIRITQIGARSGIVLRPMAPQESEIYYQIRNKRLPLTKDVEVFSLEVHGQAQALLTVVLGTLENGSPVAFLHDVEDLTTDPLLPTIYKEALRLAVDFRGYDLVENIQALGRRDGFLPHHRHAELINAMARQPSVRQIKPAALDQYIFTSAGLYPIRSDIPSVPEKIAEQLDNLRGGNWDDRQNYFRQTKSTSYLYDHERDYLNLLRSWSTDARISSAFRKSIFLHFLQVRPKEFATAMLALSKEKRNVLLSNVVRNPTTRALVEESLADLLQLFLAEPKLALKFLNHIEDVQQRARLFLTLATNQAALTALNFETTANFIQQKQDFFAQQYFVASLIENGDDTQIAKILPLLREEDFALAFRAFAQVEFFKADGIKLVKLFFAQISKRGLTIPALLTNSEGELIVISKRFAIVVCQSKLPIEIAETLRNQRNRLGGKKALDEAYRFFLGTKLGVGVAKAALTILDAAGVDADYVLSRFRIDLTTAATRYLRNRPS